MSHTMKMYVYNNSGHTLEGYNVDHAWNDKTQTAHGENLPYQKLSPPTECITGYGPEKDWYTISVNIDSIGHKSTDFYCNSSHDHKCVEISVHDEYVNCNYYKEDKPEGHSPDTSCKHKHYR